MLARLRNQTFFSLAELNAAIEVLLKELNDRPLQKLPGSRRTLFEQLDRPATKPLPQEPYVYAEWGKARAYIDGNSYSVPYPLVKQTLEVRLSAHTVEIFHLGQRVASHRRSQDRDRYTTLPEHIPEAHRAYAEWTPQRLVHWAENIGPTLAEVWRTNKLSGFVARDLSGFTVSQEVTEHETDRVATGDSDDEI